MGDDRVRIYAVNIADHLNQSEAILAELERAARVAPDETETANLLRDAAILVGLANGAIQRMIGRLQAPVPEREVSRPRLKCVCAKCMAREAALN